jgi:hypothetical protein
MAKECAEKKRKLLVCGRASSLNVGMAMFGCFAFYGTWSAFTSRLLIELHFEVGEELGRRVTSTQASSNAAAPRFSHLSRERTRRIFIVFCLSGCENRGNVTKVPRTLTAVDPQKSSE